MSTVIVTGVTRADLEVVDQLAELGVATVHEAIGRAGYLGPGLRPIQEGVHGGHAEPGQLVDHPGVGPGHAGDDHGAHQFSLSVTCGNTRM